MSEPFVASVQYGDLKGTAAIDGHSGSFLHELVSYTDMPSGFWPVGLGLYRLTPIDKGGKIPFTLYGVNCEQAGDDVEAIARFAKRSSEFPVYRFSGEIEPEVLFSMMKRIDIKVLDKTFADARNVVAYSTP